MHRVSFVLVAILSLPLFAQDQKAKPAPTLRSILLEQLRSTHNSEEWFVPANIAVEGLTAEQASWTDGKGNHSVGQLGAVARGVEDRQGQSGDCAQPGVQLHDY